MTYLYHIGGGWYGALTEEIIVHTEYIKFDEQTFFGLAGLVVVTNDGKQTSADDTVIDSQDSSAKSEWIRMTHFPP